MPVYPVRRHCVPVCRDAEETKDWIEEKDAACRLEDYGHDLATVQRLQRKHEGLERDLAALGEKVSLQVIGRNCVFQPHLVVTEVFPL